MSKNPELEGSIAGAPPAPPSGPRITGHSLKVTRNGTAGGEDIVPTKLRPDPERPYIVGVSFDRVSEVGMFYRFDSALCFNPLAYAENDEDIRRFADLLLSYSCETRDADSADAARTLVTSLVYLLRDWFRDEYYSLPSILTLLSMAELCEDDEDFKSPLDLIFLQIEEGRKYVRTPGGAAQQQPQAKASGGGRDLVSQQSSEFSWQPSTFRRKTDGVMPSEIGGLPPEQDVALGHYRRFKATGFELQKAAVELCLECMNRIAVGARERARGFVS